MRGWLAVVLLSLAGCHQAPLQLMRETTLLGWYSVRGSNDARTPIPYAERFSPLPLEKDDEACTSLMSYRFARNPRVFVLVHGIGGGVGDELPEAVSELVDHTKDRAFMFRWVQWTSRSDQARWLAAGLSNLLRCQPALRGKLFVIAHSAGGVLAADAASRIAVEPPHEPVALQLFTVASPLAGTDDKPTNANGEEEAVIMFDLATKLSVYPPAANGVRVVHLRTHWPADSVMKPKADHAPNDPKVGVAGARQIDLPERLTHVEALHFVLEKFRTGDVSAWLGSGVGTSTSGRDDEVTAKP